MITINQFYNDQLYSLSKIQLCPEGIHVWNICWSKLIEFLEKHWNIMDDSEKKMVNEFKFYDDKMRCAAGKIITRLLLSHYLGVGNTNVKIYFGKYGKPYHQMVEGKQTVQFNISHSGSILLIGFTYLGEIGVDVERIRTFSGYKDIVQKFFSEKEAEYMKTKKDEKDFFALWTEKEAYLKAKGIGLNGRLDTFYVSKGQIMEAGNLERDWYLEHISLGEEYLACIVVQKEKNNF